MDYFNAFWVGGLICALVQILLDKTKLLPGRVMVILVCSGVILRRRRTLPAVLRTMPGQGRPSVPLSRFRPDIMEGHEKAIDQDGLLGLFTGGFTACSAGVSAALIFSWIGSLIFRPKMKD